LTVVAGIDVGNATTEVVFVRHERDTMTIVGAGRLPTRGRKGAPESLAGAAAVVRRLERTLELSVDAAVVAPLRAVDTSTASVPVLPPATGRLRLVAAGAATPGGRGAVIATPVWLEDLELSGQPGSAVGPEHLGGAGAGQVCVLVPPGLDWRAAAERVGRLLAAGSRIGAVLVPGDEAVLISNRLAASVPVVDEIDTEALAASIRLAIEVRGPGEPLRLLADPVSLAAGLGLAPSERIDAAALARLVVDYSNAVVSLEQRAAGSPTQLPAWIEIGGERRPFGEAVAVLAEGAPGAVTALLLPPSAAPMQVDDLWVVDLGAAADSASQRRGTLSSRDFVIAALNGTRIVEAPAAHMTDLLEVPTVVAESENVAARAGALTTPGADPEAMVVDVGAGTIDVIAADRDVVAAGAGEMLTSAVAATLAIPNAAAEWVKRGPSIRIEGGQRFETEHGGREFLDTPPPPGSTGMLAVAGPAGLLPFARGRSPAEWRALRLGLKEAILAANLTRALRGFDGSCRSPEQVLVVGGAAGDDELLGVLARSLPPQAVVGKGNVGGAIEVAPDVAELPGGGLGHRYSAALGLAMAWRSLS